MAATVGMTVLAGCGGPGQHDYPESVPTFASGPAAGARAQAPERETLLPPDCTDVVSGAQMSALLGQPVDSVRVHTVLGLPAPSVSRLERVTCQYQRAGNRGAIPDVELILAAYGTRAAADKQLTTNAAAERYEAQSAENLSIGSARAVLFAERGKTVLMVNSGRSSVSMTMQNGVTRPNETRAVMVDLAQRVLPNLAPEPVGESR
ncbi:MAG TPA: hypothetical protein VNP03_00740 [Pseudonocardia sp.]|nr:hypothetical protein [Pseudonocardia sp.]